MPETTPWGCDPMFAAAANEGDVLDSDTLYPTLAEGCSRATVEYDD